MKKFVTIFLIIYLNSTQGQCPFFENKWMIWNVGQGQWLSNILNDSCHHYDFGGEVTYLKKIKKSFLHFCQKKINYLYLSHADFDHYSFASFIFNNTLKTCWAIKTDQFIQRQIPEIPFCSSDQSPFKSTTRILHLVHIENYKNKNLGSTVFYKAGLLLTGDSPIQAEKIWTDRIPAETKILLLGHHGSRTSTSDFLLSKLPNLQMVIASQRSKKYGHPHPDVIRRVFKSHKLGVIKTEDWGNILLQK